MLLYMGSSRWRGVRQTWCALTRSRGIFYAFVIDFSSRRSTSLTGSTRQARNSAHDFMVKTRLFLSHIVVQIFLGTLL